MPETYYCHSCKYSITLPEELENDKLPELVEIIRSGRIIDAMHFLRLKYRFGLGDSKFIATHVSRIKDHCVNCGNKLLEDGLTNCPSCSGLNFNW